MLDQILGRPSPTVRRSQILLVLFFWIWRLYKGDGAPRAGKRIRGSAGGSNVGRALRKKNWAWRLWVALVGRRAVRWIAKINDRLKNFTPYQLILGTLTVGYAFRHIGDIFGLAIPEPLASLYSRSYYRATYVNTAFDAGFASAMAIRPKWLKDISSILFALYYLIYANEGDDVLRKFRALCTVEMLRTTWEKTNNPYIRLVTAAHRPSLGVVKHLTIPRPPTSFRANLPPVKAMLFFAGTEAQLANSSQLVVDYPGGGFIAMGPECHEERLRRWARRTGKPVLGIDYGKAPEYPYPWAIEEGFDAYRTLMETKGSVIGIKSGKLDIVLTGDSAGGNICATIMLRILEHPTGIPRPVSMILAYPALDFNFTSWMSPTNLRVLRTEQSEVNIPGIVHGKDHLRHKSPLSVVDDVQPQRRTRQASWGHAIGKLAMSPLADKRDQNPFSPKKSTWSRSLPRSMSTKVANWLAAPNGNTHSELQEQVRPEEAVSDPSDSDDDTVTIKDGRSEADKSLRERVKTPRAERRFDFEPVEKATPSSGVDAEVVMSGEPVQKPKKKKNPVGTRLTMTSRSGYFQDRIISPSMMRAMAILYIGPGRNPDFETDYYISPILSPPHLLEFFPPVYLICGERDPFVDDTIVFAGKIREAKRARRARAEAALAQPSRQAHGEGLRMSATASGSATPDHIIRETDDDWVSMRIIEGWGHGFMQMTALMREVDSVLVEMADWIDESFEKHNLKRDEAKRVDQARKAAESISVPPDEVLAPEEYMPSSASTHVKPVGLYKDAAGQIHLGGADLGTPVGTEGSAAGGAGGSDEEDPPIMFTPKTKKRGPPPSRFNPVPRRSSKEKLNIHRVSSAPRFDLDETGSSGEAMSIKTPPLGARTLPTSSGEAPKGHGAFAFFGGRSTTPHGSGTTPASTGSATPKTTPPPASLFAPRRTSAGAGTASRPTNSLVAAAVAGARAASPALAAAGLVSQPVEVVSEAELIRRRRFEPFFGVAQTDSADVSDDES